MAINHAKIFNRRVTPQSQPVPGSNQVRNTGGGYSWAVDDWTRLDRFLILGAEGGTYYIKSKQEGQAALERARGESVALRNLANAAKLLESNPALLNLRLMQSLSAAQAAGNTLVLGVPGFVPLKNGKAGSPDHKPEDGAS